MIEQIKKYKGRSTRNIKIPYFYKDLGDFFYPLIHIINHHMKWAIRT